MSVLAIAGLLLGGALVGNWLHILGERELVWATAAFAGIFLGACLTSLL